jgi:ketosteroid isomerase-like protein
MSEENIEIYRRNIAAFNDGDLDAMADLITEDFEFIPYLAASVETTTYRGPDWLRQYREDAGAAWDDIQVRVDEIKDLGDRLVAFGESVDAAGAAAWLSGFRWRGWWTFTNGS